jgi:protein-S-isoprenylcysteine O-methyltransferase Ste14
VLLLIAAGLVIYGTALLRQRGQARHDRDDPALFGFEQTTSLVVEGIYRYIRHPLYSSLFFLGWGIFFKDLTWLGAGLAVAATAFLVMTAKHEEGENLRFFGAAYQTYIARTKMFIPFVF